MHRKLAFSTLADDTLGIITLAAGVVTTLHTSAKNSVWELFDYSTYFIFFISGSRFLNLFDIMYKSRNFVNNKI